MLASNPRLRRTVLSLGPGLTESPLCVPPSIDPEVVSRQLLHVTFHHERIQDAEDERSGETYPGKRRMHIPEDAVLFVCLFVCLLVRVLVACSQLLSRQASGDF